MSSSNAPQIKVPIVDYCPPSTFGTDMKVLKHMWFAKIVPGQSQQDRVGRSRGSKGDDDDV
jgi:hypothetical protein